MCEGALKPKRRLEEVYNLALAARNCKITFMDEEAASVPIHAAYEA